jgi:hypothetical protein
VTGREEHEHVESPELYWERYMATVAEHLEEFGYHLTHVDEDPRLCYSTGLERTWDHPELLLYGLSIEDSMTILGAYVSAISGGERFRHGDVDRKQFTSPIAFLEIPQSELWGRFVVTIEVYEGIDFRALQVVTPDDSGWFPWDPGCEAKVVAAQPLLGKPIASI